jgi:hypothetical protein
MPRPVLVAEAIFYPDRRYAVCELLSSCPGVSRIIRMAQVIYVKHLDDLIFAPAECLLPGRIDAEEIALKI